jgi:hypothetical protein
MVTKIKKSLSAILLICFCCKKIYCGQVKIKKKRRKIAKKIPIQPFIRIQRTLAEIFDFFNSDIP